MAVRFRTTKAEPVDVNVCLCVWGSSPGQITNAITEIETLSFLVSFKWSVYSSIIGNRLYILVYKLETTDYKLHKL